MLAPPALADVSLGPDRYRELDPVFPGAAEQRKRNAGREDLSRAAVAGFLTAIEESLALPDGLAQCLRADFCSVSSQHWMVGSSVCVYRRGLKRTQSMCAIFGIKP